MSSNPVLLALKDILDSQDHREAMALTKRDPHSPSSRKLLELVERAEAVLEAGDIAFPKVVEEAGGAEVESGLPGHGREAVKG